MRKKVLSPSELIEFRTQQQEEAKIRAAKLEEEKNKSLQKEKKLLSPKDIFNSKVDSQKKILIKI